MICPYCGNPMELLETYLGKNYWYCDECSITEVE